MIQVAGEEGISLDDYVIYQEALFLDMVYLQQDAFDEVDVSVPLVRQKENFQLIFRLVNTEYEFSDQEQARAFFVRLTGLFKNLNYTRSDSAEYTNLIVKINNLIASVKK
jgi:V/A-type H+-transporting ATPase subunit A